MTSQRPRRRLTRGCPPTLAVAALAATWTVATAKPHVLLYILDDLGWSDTTINTKIGVQSVSVVGTALHAWYGDGPCIARCVFAQILALTARCSAFEQLQKTVRSNRPKC